MPTRAASPAAEAGTASSLSSRARTGSSAAAAASALSMTSTSCMSITMLLTRKLVKGLARPVQAAHDWSEPALADGGRCGTITGWRTPGRTGHCGRWGSEAVLCLAACSSADTDRGVTVRPARDRRRPRALHRRPRRVRTPDAESSVSGADLCEYLAGQLPQLREIGSEVGAMANVTVNLYSWYEGQGAVPDGDRDRHPDRAGVPARSAPRCSRSPGSRASRRSSGGASRTQRPDLRHCWSG